MDRWRIAPDCSRIHSSRQEFSVGSRLALFALVLSRAKARSESVSDSAARCGGTDRGENKETHLRKDVCHVEVSPPNCWTRRSGSRTQPGAGDCRDRRRTRSASLRALPFKAPCLAEGSLALLVAVVNRWLLAGRAKRIIAGLRGMCEQIGPDVKVCRISCLSATWFRGCRTRFCKESRGQKTIVGDPWTPDSRARQPRLSRIGNFSKAVAFSFSQRHYANWWVFG
jgi:hypothetical protein